ncbi:hypothetical protein J7E50_17825 [Pedobacter sp. ISL-68]|uniref:hypothetical protein n=1 Tax=unclassified Pedobacter TaxID=2628915 RepID=UPI001BE4F3E3|nr:MULTISPECIES: hypothetical protein [unclassified Pedobacter]MBT2559783.1 hypothetical protein [Pedobacter sp. ISL-64]MBT2592088.1 hypothetical protein [Pedobacter sp. ISL-68]
MKKMNLLSRAEMKNVMGGNTPVANPCLTGDYHDYDICFNCCVVIGQEYDPTDDGVYDYCDGRCS